jgi:ribosome biogenesis GTPase / thiamine phosphate phosphatase
LAAVATSRALVIATFGRQALVARVIKPEATSSEIPELNKAKFDLAHPLLAVTRGRRQDVLVGDLCEVSLSSETQAVIEAMQTRRNFVRRADHYKTKSLAANLDMIAIVVSGSPPCSEDLLFRMLTAAQAEALPCLIVVNKSDLDASAKFAKERLAWTAAQQQAFVLVSVKQDPGHALSVLSEHFKDKRVLLMGESGMGKSTLLNLLVPDAAAHTQEISRVLNAGKHTTTFARLYPAGHPQLGQCELIDTPGFQLFGLSYLSITELMHAVPEVKARLGQCRFSNCLHLDEPSCAVRAASASGDFDSVRYKLFRELVPEAQR